MNLSWHIMKIEDGKTFLARCDRVFCHLQHVWTPANSLKALPNLWRRSSPSKINFKLSCEGGIIANEIWRSFTIRKSTTSDAEPLMYYFKIDHLGRTNAISNQAPNPPPDRVPETWIREPDTTSGYKSVYELGEAGFPGPGAVFHYPTAETFPQTSTVIPHTHAIEFRRDIFQRHPRTPDALGVMC